MTGPFQNGRNHEAPFQGLFFTNHPDGVAMGCELPARGGKTPLIADSWYEVLVRMNAAGVCHGNLHVMKGDLWMPLPILPRHGGIGTLTHAQPIFAASTVAVFGCGGVGRNTGQGTRWASTTKIVEVDPVAPRNWWPGCDVSCKLLTFSLVVPIGLHTAPSHLTGSSV